MTAIRRLPDGELEVMQALWDCAVPASRGEIEEHFQKRFQRRPAMTTLLTHLTRLGEKGFVRIEKEGRQNRYTPWSPGKATWPARASISSRMYARGT